MKRTYISPEYQYNKVGGLLNMKEHSTFFGSKMMELPNNLYIDNEVISYYQNSANEQIDFANEQRNVPNVVDLNMVKKLNHVMYKDTSVGVDSGYVTWVVEVDLRKILQEYIFGNIKRSRIFTNVLNPNLLNNDVDLSIRDYIRENIMNRYAFDKVELYVNYVSLSESGRLIGSNVYGYNTVKNTQVLNTTLVFNSDYSIMKIQFKQIQDYKQFGFDYYFNLIFNKI